MIRKDFIKLPAWIMLLPKIEKDTLHQISMENKISYSSASTLLKNFKEKGYLTYKKIGRMNEIKLTEKGIKVAHYCQALINEVETK